MILFVYGGSAKHELLLVNAIDHSRNIETVFPSLETAYLSSSLKNHFPNIQIKIIDRDIENVIKSYCPELCWCFICFPKFWKSNRNWRFMQNFEDSRYLSEACISLLPESYQKRLILEYTVRGRDNS